MRQSNRRFVARVRAVRPGDPLSENIDVGSSIGTGGFRKVLRLVADVVAKGAREGGRLGLERFLEIKHVSICP